QRAASLGAELDGTRRRLEELHRAIAAGEMQLDRDVLDLDARRQTVLATDEVVAAIRAKADAYEAAIKDARARLDAIRATVSELDVARATAEADLSHLGHTCEDAVGATLDEVIAEVELLEQSGAATPDSTLVLAPEDTGEEEEVVSRQSSVIDLADTVMSPTDDSGLTDDLRLTTEAKRTLSAEEAIAALRGKIE